jgi:hypothetical protein
VKRSVRQKSGGTGMILGLMVSILIVTSGKLKITRITPKFVEQLAGMMLVSSGMKAAGHTT